MILLSIIAMVYVTCGVLAYGMFMADFQWPYPLIAQETYNSTVKVSVALSLFGPVSLVMAIILTNLAEHGLMFRNPHRSKQ